MKVCIAKNKFIAVKSLEEASKVTRDNIVARNIGSSRWYNSDDMIGHVLDDSNNFVARVSYNGRLWDINDNIIEKQN